MRLSSKIVLCLASALVPAAAAQAATQTTSIAISAAVVATCTVGANPLAFANYSGAVVNTTTTISPNCSSGTPYWIQIDAGAGSGATTGGRKMTNGSSQTLDYNLYTTVGATQTWGIIQGTDTVTGTGTGALQTVTVYGRIIAGQSAAVGTGYADTVGVTLNF